ncbi:MAG: hypothetical protein HQL96_01655, partial [Magnetococcales bacterium]|nr:hypothetical protein [Magnetococcales bacterium]
MDEEHPEIPEPFAPMPASRRPPFTLAVTVSLCLHLLIALAVSLRWFPTHAPPPPSIPVQLVFLPPSKQKSEAPKQADAVAEQDHQATAEPAVRDLPATSPQATSEPVSVPPPPEARAEPPQKPVPPPRPAPEKPPPAATKPTAPPAAPPPPPPP